MFFKYNSKTRQSVNGRLSRNVFRGNLIPGLIFQDAFKYIEGFITPIFTCVPFLILWKQRKKSHWIKSLKKRRPKKKDKEVFDDGRRKTLADTDKCSVDAAGLFCLEDFLPLRIVTESSLPQNLALGSPARITYNFY